MMSNAEKVYVSIHDNIRNGVLIPKVMHMQKLSIFEYLSDIDRFYQHFGEMLNKIRCIYEAGEMSEEEKLIFFEHCIKRMRQNYIVHMMSHSFFFSFESSDGGPNCILCPWHLAAYLRYYKDAAWKLGLLMALLCANDEKVTMENIDSYARTLDEVFCSGNGGYRETPTRASIKLLLDYVMQPKDDKNEE